MGLCGVGLTVTLPVPAALVGVLDAHRHEAVGAGGHGWGVALHLHELHGVVVLADGHGAVTQPPGLVLLQVGRAQGQQHQPGAQVHTGGVGRAGETPGEHLKALPRRLKAKGNPVQEGSQPPHYSKGRVGEKVAGPQQTLSPASCLKPSPNWGCGA